MNEGDLPQLDWSDPPRAYDQLLAQLRALIENERDPIANLANAAALLFAQLPNINWAGFYLLKNNQLVLGPFAGKPACVRIQLGRGVCGTAAQKKQPLIVPDVRAFPGHIACDPSSASEIVIPLLLGSRLLGVLDIDSPTPARFSEPDLAALTQIAAALVTGIDWPIS